MASWARRRHPNGAQVQAPIPTSPRPLCSGSFDHAVRRASGQASFCGGCRDASARVGCAKSVPPANRAIRASQPAHGSSLRTPQATGRKSNGLRNRRNKRKPLPRVATSCHLEPGFSGCGSGRRNSGVQQPRNSWANRKTPRLLMRTMRHLIGPALCPSSTQ
jgi:hypothetical protein